MRHAPNARARSDLEQSALIRARALVDRMRSLYRELEQLTGAPITLHRALLCIGEEPGLAASELAQRLGMKRPAMSQALKNLSTRGWVERRRSASDQRSVQIFTTDEGKRVLKLSSGRAVVILKKAVQAMGIEDLVRLTSGLEALLLHLPRDGTRSASRRRPRLPLARSAED